MGDGSGYFESFTFFSFEEELQSLKETRKAWFYPNVERTCRSLNQNQTGSSQTKGREVLTSSYVDVGGDAKIKAATLRWYHGSSAKAKHLSETRKYP